jgi:hypothetical protein
MKSATSAPINGETSPDAWAQERLKTVPMASVHLAIYAKERAESLGRHRISPLAGVALLKAGIWRRIEGEMRISVL